METFFILFTLVFALFLWYLESAFRYTDETVGKNSPVYTERTYQFSASQYFGQFIKLLLIFTLIISLLLVQVMTNVAIQQHKPFVFLFAFSFLSFAGFLVFFFYVDWLYWSTFTRHVAITFDPFQPSLIIYSSNQTHLITSQNLLRIEHHLTQSSNSKYLFGGYGYILFYTTDGQIAQINNIFFNHVGHTEFVERFFPTVTQTIVWHRPLAWPTRINTDEKQVA